MPTATAIATALPSLIASSRMKVFFSESSSSCCAQLGIDQRRMLLIVAASSAATLLEHLFSPSSSYWVPILLILWLSMKVCLAYTLSSCSNLSQSFLSSLFSLLRGNFGSCIDIRKSFSFVVSLLYFILVMMIG